MMREYDFTLILSGITPETAGVEDRLCEAGCDDATLSFRSGRPILTFSRHGTSAAAAITSAIGDVRKANIGAEVVRVNASNLVTLSEIARRMERPRQVVHQYLRGQRGPSGFPAPVCELGSGQSLWSWCEVANWLYTNDMLKEEALRESQEIELINGVLEMASCKKRDSRLATEILTQLMSIGVPCE